MEENEITTIIKEKTDAIKYAYKDALDILDAYDHQTLTRPEGAYYDGDETREIFWRRFCFATKVVVF